MDLKCSLDHQSKQRWKDFDTGNVRFKARERYSFGFSDPRCVFGNGNLPTS